MKHTLLGSILGSKCPQCRQEKIFEAGTYKLSKMTKMKKTCPSCGLMVEREPSFFTGSMYVSYAFSVAIVVATFVAFNVLTEDPSTFWMVFFGVGTAVVFAPLNFRLSRMIWLNIFVRYKPGSAGTAKSDPAAQ